jgi:transcriptional regulator with XRE-family HTH domain
MKNMRKARDRKKMRMDTLADRTGIPASSLWNYEAMRQEPTVTKGVLIAQALDTTAEALVGLTKKGE